MDSPGMIGSDYWLTELASDLTAMQPQPRAHYLLSSSPDMASFHHITRNVRRWGGVYLCVHHGNTAGCMAMTAVSYKLGSPRGFR